MDGFSEFFVIVGCKITFQEWIVPKWLEKNPTNQSANEIFSTECRF